MIPYLIPYLAAAGFLAWMLWFMGREVGRHVRLRSRAEESLREWQAIREAARSGDPAVREAAAKAFIGKCHQGPPRLEE